MLTLVSEPIDEYAVAHTSPLPPLLAELQATTWERMGRRALMMSGLRPCDRLRSALSSNMVIMQTTSYFECVR